MELYGFIIISTVVQEYFMLLFHTHRKLIAFIVFLKPNGTLHFQASVFQMSYKNKLSVGRFSGHIMHNE